MKINEKVKLTSSKINFIKKNMWNWKLWWNMLKKNNDDDHNIDFHQKLFLFSKLVETIK